MTTNGVPNPTIHTSTVDGLHWEYMFGRGEHSFLRVMADCQKASLPALKHELEFRKQPQGSARSSFVHGVIESILQNDKFAPFQIGINSSTKTA